jgi:hypothetical protein
MRTARARRRPIWRDWADSPSLGVRVGVPGWNEALTVGPRDGSVRPPGSGPAVQGEASIGDGQGQTLLTACAHLGLAQFREPSDGGAADLSQAEGVPCSQRPPKDPCPVHTWTNVPNQIPDVTSSLNPCLCGDVSSALTPSFCGPRSGM